jgi:hypothetical protein
MVEGVNGFNNAGDGLWAFGNDERHGFFSFFQKCFRGTNFIGQSYLKRFLGGNHFTGKNQLHGHVFAHQPCKALGTSVSGNKAEVYFRLSEFCFFRCINKMAGKCKFATSSQCKAVYSRNDGFGSEISAPATKAFSPAPVIITPQISSLE